MKKKYVIFILFLIFVFSLSASETVRIGWYNEAGLQGENAQGSPWGYNYEYLKKIQSFTDWKFEYVHGTPSELLEELYNGNIDLLCFFKKTEEREKKAYFSSIPIGKCNTVLLASQNNDEIGFNDAKGIRGLRVVIDNYFAKDINQPLINEYDLNTVKIPYDENFYESINDDKADLIITSDIADVPSGKFKTVIKSPEEYYYIAVNKNKKELLDELNSILNKINTSDPTYNDVLYAKYFGDNAESIPASYTKEDIEYLLTEPVVRVLNDGTLVPFQYKDENTEKLKVQLLLFLI